MTSTHCSRAIPPLDSDGCGKLRTVDAYWLPRLVQPVGLTGHLFTVHPQAPDDADHELVISPQPTRKRATLADRALINRLATLIVNLGGDIALEVADKRHSLSAGHGRYPGTIRVPG